MPESRPLWRTAVQPRWVGLFALALVIAGVMAVMGIWQLGVYKSKTAEATAHRAAEAPVPLQSLFSVDDGLPSKAVGRQVTITGTWGPATDQVYTSDRQQDGKNGFWVVTPLKLSDTDAVMVVRGWVPTVSDPAAKAPAGPVSLTGAVVASEAQDSSGDAAKGRVLSSLRIPTIVHLVKYRIYDAFVVQTSPAATSPAPAAVTPPPPPTDHAGLRNVAYAFQWWIFAAFTLWMWFRMVLDAHRTPDTPAPQDATHPTPHDPASPTSPSSTSLASPTSDPPDASPTDASLTTGSTTNASPTNAPNSTASTAAEAAALEPTPTGNPTTTGQATTR